MSEDTKKPVAKLTNAQFAKKIMSFRKACQAINIEPTRRQASKWRRATGRAWKEGIYAV